MSKSLEEKIKETARSVEPSPHFRENLWREMQRSTQPARAPRWRWLPAAALTALVVVVLAISPQQVWASLRGLFDFLPGIGLVQDDESTLYLYEPVSQTQDGITLTIQQVVSDTNQTVVAYRIEGLPAEGNCFYDRNSLLLPDGKRLLPIGGGSRGGETTNEARVEFMPLPEGVTQATLLTERSPEAEDTVCEAPLEWQVDFNLGTEKPADMELLPVVESTASSQEPDESAAAGDSAANRVRLFVDSAVELDDGYILYGHIQGDDPNWMSVNLNFFDGLSASDADGRPVTLDTTDESMSDNEFVFKVVGKDFTPPLTLHVANLYIHAHLMDTPAFTFDAGQDPQIGQTWTLDQPLEIQGLSLTVESVEAFQSEGHSDAEGAQPALRVTVRKDPDKPYLNGFIVCQGEEEDQGSGGQTMPTEDGKLLMESSYARELPKGEVKCSFADLTYLLEGDWQIDWQPAQAE
ncbi:MAG: hypothetical protein PWQ55_1228 [Chloroflexota bacterium]|nr:hypothetical protein [Chloroflexota bacterium]